MERAAAMGLAAVSLTDHDSVGGVAEAETAAARLGLGFVRGTEISAEALGAEIHVLGYGIDPEHPRLTETLAQLEARRAERADRIVERLRGLGVPVDRERILERAGGTIGRMHIAREILDLGFSETVQGAFDKYIKSGRPAYVSKVRLPCDETIRLIHDAGGLAVLAHPGIGTLHRKLARILEFPFDGIEVYHSKHTPGHTAEFLELAVARGLLVTGGSDCHGHAKNAPEMGTVRVPYAHFAALQEALARVGT